MPAEGQYQKEKSRAICREWIEAPRISRLSRHGVNGCIALWLSSNRFVVPLPTLTTMSGTPMDYFDSELYIPTYPNPDGTILTYPHVTSPHHNDITKKGNKVYLHNPHMTSIITIVCITYQSDAATQTQTEPHGATTGTPHQHTHCHTQPTTTTPMPLHRPRHRFRCRFRNN